MPRCDRCRFFHPYPPADVPGRITICGDSIRGGGECRLHPPVRNEHEPLACFPVVANEWWCGRFEGNPPVYDREHGLRHLAASPRIVVERASDSDKIVRKLREAPHQELPHRVLMRRARFDANTLQAAIQPLVEQGIVTTAMQATRTRPRRVYRLMQ